MTDMTFQHTVDTYISFHEIVTSQVEALTPDTAAITAALLTVATFMPDMRDVAGGLSIEADVRNANGKSFVHETP